MSKTNATKTESLWDVWAVIGDAPIEKQNAKPLKRVKADDLASRLKRGKTKAQRVYIVRAGTFAQEVVTSSLDKRVA